MTELEAVIAETRRIFPEQRLRAPLDVCKTCCVTAAEERELIETPRDALSSDLLWVYLHSGVRPEPSQWELEHFLPRLLELIAHGDPPGTLGVALSRLKLHPRARWRPEGYALLERFVLAFFEERLASEYGRIHEVLQMVERGGLDVGPLLAAWLRHPEPEATDHFAALLLALSRPSPLPEELPERVRRWLDEPGVRETFQARIADRMADPLAVPPGVWKGLNEAYLLLW